jgi:D-alanine-D-alanine ligase
MLATSFMEPEWRRTDFAVLLLHNLDPSWEPADVESVMESVQAMKTALKEEGHPVLDLPVSGTDVCEILKPFDPDHYIVFNWCEELSGIPRSDVMVAQALEDLKFSYTGSPPEILSLSWDKAAVKRLLCKHNIATPNWRVFSRPGTEGWDCFPAIVKPAFEHCSSGITAEAVVFNVKELVERIGFVVETFEQPALVEDFIDGREFHVTICGNRTVEMLPAAEMDFSALDNLRDRLCTFDSKFMPGSLHYEKIELKIPAALNAQEILELERTALLTYKMMGCRDYARIDVRLREGTFFVLDVNPNADITPDTSLAYAAEAAGLSYGILGSTLVNFAARRHPTFGSGVRSSS